MKCPSIQYANSRTIICLSIGTIARVVARQGTTAIPSAGLQAGNDGGCKQGKETSAMKLGGGLAEPVSDTRNVDRT